MDDNDPHPPVARDSPPVARNTPPVARNFSSAKYTASDYIFQFITVTAGVLIALLVNGFVELRDTRALLRQAHSTIAEEITANKRELDGVLSTYSTHRSRFEAAITFADQLLATKTTAVNQLDFGFELAELSSAAWRTSERTGALSHMGYDEVKKYSMLYDFQEFFSAQQLKIAEHVTSATALFSSGFEPEKATARDLEVFRQHMVELRGLLTVQEQLAKRLAEKYLETQK